jgi:predicted nucleotidyltransferase
MDVDILNLKSQLRRKLLKLFFTNPEKKYYARQLERLIGHSASNVSAELRRLKEGKLFTTDEVGGIIFYQLNQNHPLYPELKSIIAKTIGAEGGLREALAPLAGIRCAFIFGSFARGEEHEMSDIDLFIIGNPDSDELGDVIRQQEDVLNREINYHVYSTRDWEDKRAAKEGFVLNLMEKPKIFLIGGEECL